MTAAPRRIGVATVARSDYGHLRPVLDGIRRAPELELLLFVAGAHLDPAFGSTVSEIEADGFAIAERIAMLEGGDTPEAIAASTGHGVEGFARAFARRRPDLLVAFHPGTLEYRDTAAHVDELLAALEKTDGTLILTYPNADTSGRLIMERLEEFTARHPGRCRLVRNLGERRYLSLLRHADVMVGNSSSGLIEAPSFGLPAVNIGARQRGRLRGANVIDVEPARDEILRGVETAQTPAFRAHARAAANPYGDGRAAPRIVEILKTIPLDARLIQKRFADAEGGR